MKKAVRMLSVLAFCLVVPIGVGGQEAGTPVDESALVLSDAAPGPSGAQASTSILPYIIRMVLVLGIVVALIYGLYALLRRAGRPKAQPDSPLKLLASAPVGPGRALVLASLGQKAWLLGSTDSSISLIAEIDDKELIDSLELKAQYVQSGGGQDFAGMLMGLLKPKGGASSTPRRHDDFLSRQRDRLKKF